MPFFPTEDNLAKVLAGHLKPGETVLGMVGVPRLILGLTPQRVLHSTFPVWSKSKVEFEAPVGEGTTIETHAKGSQGLTVLISHGGTTHKITMHALLGGAPERMAELLLKAKELGCVIKK